MAWELVIDCSDPDRLADFWCAALDYRRHGQVAQYRSIVPAEGRDGPKVILQQVPEHKSGKNRLHIDVAADDLEAEAARLIAAGVRRARAEPIQEFGIEWILMEDPEGNEFCIVPS